MIEEEITTNKIEELKNKFNEIKKMGYIESLSSGRGNIGLTFEQLIGKENDNFQVSDYEGIEIKCKHGFSKSYITLFSLVPSGKNFFETKRIREKFGYNDDEFSDIKVITRSAWVRYKNPLKSGYKMSLEINKKEKRIYLCFYDKNDKLIDKDTFWDFDDVANTLYRKMNILALVKAWPNHINGKTYYKYYEMKFYKLKSFDNFLKAMNQGKIRIDVQQSVFRSGKYKGKEHDRGTTFGIKECDLLDLYDEYNQ